jgi:hypothetical protein
MMHIELYPPPPVYFIGKLNVYVDISKQGANKRANVGYANLLITKNKQRDASTLYDKGSGEIGQECCLKNGS